MIQGIQNCPICGESDSADFFGIGDVPVTCATIFPSRQEALAVPTGDVNLATCGACGFVFNRSFDPALGAISSKYESSQAASAHFGEFAQSLARDWTERYELRGRTILEVGCGNGDFLRRLVDEGVGEAIGIDPVCDSAAVARRAERAIRLITDTFDVRHIDLKADALVCRHTIEHIQNVSEFLRTLSAWARRNPRHVLLFELPASERVFSERAFWDVYYEHCNYFTERTVRIAFEEAGFDVLRASRVYDGQYLIVEAVVGGQERTSSTAAGLAAAHRECEEFGSEVRRSIERCRVRLAELSSDGKPLVLWQGASKTVGFLSALGNHDMIDSAIDLNPQRHGKFLPGSGLPVYAPEELVRLQPRHVVLMNAVYMKEVQAQICDLGVRCTVHPVNALLSEAPTA